MEPGQRVFGRYVLQERLAPPGPVAQVWRAWTDDGATFALKFPGPAVDATPAWRNELRTVVASCEMLTDGVVVAPLHYLEDGPLLAVASSDVPFRSLASLRQDQPGGVFAPADLHWLLHQLCRTLDRLAGHPGYPHGDLRPAHFVPVPRGEFRLLDYRVSALFRRACDTTQLDAARQKGFFSTYSPQLVARQPPTLSDDIYALGASIYELLTGNPPFRTGNILHDIQNERPAEMGRRRDELGLPDLALPTHWEETVAACLAKEPERRPANPDEILERLQIDPAARCPWNVPAPPEKPRPAPVLPPPMPAAPPPAPPRRQWPEKIVVQRPPEPVRALPVKPSPPVRPYRPRRRLGCVNSCLLLVALVVLATCASRLVNGPSTSSPTPRPEVSGSFGDIQRAIDAAAAGGVVRIADGTYTGNLRLKSGVSLEGVSRTRGKVVVRAGASARNTPVASGSHLKDVHLVGIDFEGPGHAGGDPGTAAVVELRDCETTLESCRVLNGGRDGLAVEGGTIRLHDCAFSSNGNDGVRVEGPSGGALEMSACEVRRNGSNGFLLIGPITGHVSGNIFESNSGCGAVFIGTRRTPSVTIPELLNNRSRSNSQSGFYFGRGAQGRVNENYAEHNTQQGFVISDPGTAPALHHNTSTGNGAYGYASKNGAPAFTQADNLASGNEMGNVGR